MPIKDLIELTSGFIYTYYLIKLAPHCEKYVYRNLEVSSFKSFLGIQLPRNYEMLVILGLLQMQGCPSLCILVGL